MTNVKESLALKPGMRREEKTIKFDNVMLLLSLPIVIFAILAAEKGTAMLSTVAVAVVILYCLIAKPEQSICVIATVSMLQNSLHLGGDNSMYLFVLAFLFKVLLRQKKRVFKDIYSLVGLVVLLFVEIFTDYLSIAGFGATLVTSVYVVFLIYTLSMSDSLHFDAFTFILVYLTGFLTACIEVMNFYGGAHTYISTVLTSSSVPRFGADVEMFIGGAMGIPLYALVLLSVSLVYLLQNRDQNKYKKVIALTAVAVSFGFGMLTVSRSFLLGLAAFLLVFLCSYKSKKKWPIVICALLCLCIFAIVFNDITDKVIYNFIYRIDTDVGGGSGRLIIWEACFEYLFSDPIITFFGAGSASYIGFSSGEKFDVSAGAHNLLLDILMSWGFVGAFIVIGSIVAMLHFIRRKYGKIDGFSLAPLLTYAAFAMTALRTNSLPTWSLLFIVLFMVPWYAEEKKKNDT